MKRENKETMKIINVDGTEFISLDYHNHIIDELINDDETKQEINFNVGDVVVLKSGSPLMTIIRFDDDEWAVCSWYSEMGEVYLTTPFPTECLKEVEKEYIDDNKSEIDIEPIKEIIKDKSIEYQNEYIKEEPKTIRFARDMFYDGAYWMLNELVGNE